MVAGAWSHELDVCTSWMDAPGAGCVTGTTLLSIQTLLFPLLTSRYIAVTGTTLISLQILLFPLHHCDIHELELELELVASA